MTRPTVTHDGFLIPNASGVGRPILAEPDQIDFNTLANDQWGVIEGCAVNSQSAKAVAVQAGTAIVNGKLVTTTGGTINLPTPGTNAQFVLIVINDSGVIKSHAGLPAIDPIFPDPDLNETVLASVYCDATSGSFADTIVDKRKLLSNALLTKISPTGELIRNLNNTGNHFLMTGDGKMVWEGDTKLYRSAAETLKVENDLAIGDDLTVTGDVAAASVTATGKVLGSNLRQGTALPGTANDGDLFVHTSTGSLYVWIGGAWNQFASMSATQGVVPIGTIIFSMQLPAVMTGLGWYPMNGTQTLLETQHPVIFTIPIGATVTGTPGSRTMTLPNLTKRVLMVDFGAVAQVGPSGRTSNNLTISVDQLPKHNHSVGGATGKTSTIANHNHAGSIDTNTGTHSHAITGGYHDHPVYDPKHRHEGMDWFGQAAQIIAKTDFPGSSDTGKNKIDAMFNDSSHTDNVMPVRWTTLSATGIDIGPNTAHSHSISASTGGHDHTVTNTAAGGHDHTVAESDVGLGKTIDVTPLNYTVYAYIRA